MVPVRPSRSSAGFEKSAPLDTPVTGDAVYFPPGSREWKLPITPPPFKNHGNYVVSLSKLVKWLRGAACEKAGVNVFTRFAGASLIYEGNRVGVYYRNKGIDENSKPKDNFTPGYDYCTRESRCWLKARAAL